MNEDNVSSMFKRSMTSDLVRHILPSAGTMIGICATLIELVKLLEGQTGPTYADEWGAISALIFLFSAIFSYLAIGTVIRVRLRHMLERIADLLLCRV
ncbi:MAG: putative rane protein [Hyphomicrobiales bacterium]|nr:putative rane protein [Hyphomicrobiales bacterium]